MIYRSHLPSFFKSLLKLYSTIGIHVFKLIHTIARHQDQVASRKELACGEKKYPCFLSREKNILSLENNKTLNPGLGCAVPSSEDAYPMKWRLVQIIYLSLSVFQGRGGLGLPYRLVHIYIY